jgi:prevent-host-death family protein
MTSVGLKALKSKLSDYVRRAAAGERIVITDRGRPVAELAPPPRAEPESVIERGIREGWITAAKNRGGIPPPPKPVPGLTFEKLIADLEKDREDHW